MRCTMCQIQKERFLLCLIYKIYPMIGDQISQITFFRAELGLLPPVSISFLVYMAEIINIPTYKTPKLIKALHNRTKFRLITQVPFTKDASIVTSFFEKLCHCIMVRTHARVPMMCCSYHTGDPRFLWIQ